MPPKFIQEKIQSYCRQFGMAIGSYYALLPSGELVQNLSFAATKQFEKFIEESFTITFQPGVDIVGKVWKEEKYHWENNTADLSKAEFSRCEIALKEGIHASITVPVFENKKKCGVAEFFFWENRKEDPLIVKMLVQAFSRT